MQKIMEFLRGEKGEANIIAVILILAIVIALVVIFRENIEEMVDQIWSNIQGNFGEALPSN